MIIWYLILTVLWYSQEKCNYMWIVLKIDLVNSIVLILPFNKLKPGVQQWLLYLRWFTSVSPNFGCEMSSFRIGFQHKLTCQLKGQLVFDWKQFWRVNFFSAAACPCTLIIDFQLCTCTPKLYYHLLAILPLEMLLNRLKHPYFQVAYILKVYNIHNCQKLFMLFV